MKNAKTIFKKLTFFTKLLHRPEIEGICQQRDPIETINGIIQKFEISSLLDWLKKAEIFKFLEDPIYS